MKEVAIRWHSRAGQGGVTVANALTAVANQLGWHVQSFPEFTAEKRGPPVTVYNRLSRQPIKNIAKPEQVDFVVLLDTTLLSSSEVPLPILAAGAADGCLLANTTQTHLNCSSSFRTAFVLPASQISIDTIGRHIPNVPMLGALVRLAEISEEEKFTAALKVFLTENLNPDLVAKNLLAFHRGYAEVTAAK